MQSKSGKGKTYFCLIMIDARAKKPTIFYKKKRERKFDFLTNKKDVTASPYQLLSLGTSISNSRNDVFNQFNYDWFPLFRSNLIYVQLYSGMNKREFSIVANISNHTLSDKNFGYPTTLPIHVFLKCYSIMLHYIPSIEFCDMFSIDFSKAYPWHKDNLNANRIKMGKKPLKNI